MTNKPIQADRQAFFAEFTRHSRQIYAHIRTLVPQQADAEDVFQETSAILWEKFDEFTPGTNFVAWACRIAYYRVLNLRQRTHRAPIAFSDDFYEVVDRETNALSEELAAQHRALADCYQKLTHQDRELIDQRYRLGATVKDVAEATGRNLRSVYRALERVHGLLLECVERKVEDEERL